MITYDNDILLRKTVKIGDQVLLLGSQEMNLAHCQANQRVLARDYYTEYHIEDVDINFDALFNIDLSKYAPSAMEGYDVIADFGTTEHVSDPANCIRNVCAWLAVDGTAIFVNPGPGYIDEINHKDCPRFTVEFWEWFASTYNYEILMLDSKPAYTNAPTAIETRCILKANQGSIAPKKRELSAVIASMNINETTNL